MSVCLPGLVWRYLVRTSSNASLISLAMLLASLSVCVGGGGGGGGGLSDVEGV